MSHNKAFLEKDVLTNILWSMIPETKAFCPRGLGIVPYMLPSSVELADETIKARYRLGKRRMSDLFDLFISVD